MMMRADKTGCGRRHGDHHSVGPAYRSKKAANREKDRIHLKELEELKKRTRP
jgi:hypothetical protein